MDVREKFIEISAEAWAVIGALGGAVATEGIRAISSFIKSRRESGDKSISENTTLKIAEIDDEAKQRQELRNDIIYLRGEMRRQDELIIKLQSDYFKLAQEANQVRIELNSTKNELMDTKRELLKAQGELIQARQQIAALESNGHA
jgi:uncharacterized coiled-coil DUF342 family protein